MIMLIGFVGTLTRTTMDVGTCRVAFPSKESMMGSVCLLYGKPQVFICVISSITISGGPASYFIEIVMLISFEY